MADFAQFGIQAVDMAKACADNCDRAGVANFLVHQQNVIQADRIKARLDGPKDKPGGASGSNGAKVSDPAVTGEASGAFLRLKALLGQK